MTAPQYRRHECTVDGRVVKLLPCECEMLAILLVCDPSQFTSTDDLFGAIWPNPDLEPNYAIDIIIHRLRAKGVQVENWYGGGWRIPAHHRADKQALTNMVDKGLMTTPDTRLAA
jgi:DNA-binding response OmpR family regulator